jgi:hypothetical protein
LRAILPLSPHSAAVSERQANETADEARMIELAEQPLQEGTVRSIGVLDLLGGHEGRPGSMSAAPSGVFCLDLSPTEPVPDELGKGVAVGAFAIGIPR